MKKFLFKTICLLTLSTSSLIVACNNNSESATYTKDATSVYKAIKELKGKRNYTLEVKNTILGDKGSVFFNKNYFYNEINSTGYIVDSSKGTYSFDVDSTGSIIGGEIISTSKDISKMSNVYYFDNFDLDENETFSETETDVTLKAKTNKTLFLNMVGEDTSYISTCQSFTASFDVKKLELVLTMNFTDGNYISATVKNLGESSSDLVDEFIKNGGTYYTPSEEFITMRNNFRANNYTHYVYDNNYDAIVGKEYFTQQYWCREYDYTKYTDYAGYSTGYVCFNNQTLNDNGTLRSVDSAYMYYPSAYKVTYEDQKFNIVYGDIPADSSKEAGASYKKYVFPYLTAPAFYERITDISKAMNYPGYLDLFNYYHLFSWDEANNVYFTSDYLITLDAYKNFGMANMGIEISLVGCGFNFDFKTDPTNPSATIKVFYYYNSEFCYSDFTFRDFGTTRHEGTENFLNDYQLAW